MRELRFLSITKQPSIELLGMLNSNVIGTLGQGMLYQHLKVADKISRIPDPYFVNLMHGGKIIGTSCFCSRTIVNHGRTGPAFYIRYFSFREKYRSKARLNIRRMRKSELRSEIESVFVGKQFHLNGGEKFLHYGYVDASNSRSLAMCEEFGFEVVRQYTAIIFSRINPRANDSVYGASPAEQDEMRKLLIVFNHEHNMVSFENLFSGRKYHVVKDEEGKIVAGVQANPDAWKILSLPGIKGKLILNLFSAVPFLKTLINKNYQFLTLEGIYYKAGFESSLEILFETLLAKYRMNSAVVVVDSDSQLYRHLKSLKLGLTDKVNKETKGNVICRFVNFTDDEKVMFRKNPAFISGIDVT